MVGRGGPQEGGSRGAEVGPLAGLGKTERAPEPEGHEPWHGIMETEALSIREVGDAGKLLPWAQGQSCTGKVERETFPRKAASFLWVREAERASPREQGHRFRSLRREGWWPAVSCGGKGPSPHPKETRTAEPPSRAPCSSC